VGKDSEERGFMVRGHEGQTDIKEGHLVPESKAFPQKTRKKKPSSGSIGEGKPNALLGICLQIIRVKKKVLRTSEEKTV